MQRASAGNTSSRLSMIGYLWLGNYFLPRSYTMSYVLSLHYNYAGGCIVRALLCEDQPHGARSSWLATSRFFSFSGPSGLRACVEMPDWLLSFAAGPEGPELV